MGKETKLCPTYRVEPPQSICICKIDYGDGTFDDCTFLNCNDELKNKIVIGKMIDDGYLTNVFFTDRLASKECKANEYLYKISLGNLSGIDTFIPYYVGERKEETGDSKKINPKNDSLSTLVFKEEEKVYRVKENVDGKNDSQSLNPSMAIIGPKEKMPIENTRIVYKDNSIGNKVDKVNKTRYEVDI